MTGTNDVFISVSLFTMRGSRRVATYPVPRMISPAITQDNTEMMIRVRITPLMTLNVRRPGYIRYRITSHPSAIVISVSVVTFDYPSPLHRPRFRHPEIEDRNMPWEKYLRGRKIVDKYNKGIRSL